jgi:TRAP transporter TAXI family solute receptor
MHKIVSLLLIGILVSSLIIGAARPASDNESGAVSITDLKMGYTSMGSTAQMMGSAISTVVNNHVPNLKLTVQATGGATENPRTMAQKLLDICHVNDAYSAYNGVGPFNGEKPVELWGLFPLYPTEFLICVLEDSSIQSVEDLVGKKVSTGPPGSGTSQTLKAVLGAYGIFDKIKNSNLGYNESVDAFKDGTVDAIAMYSNYGIPSPALAQLDQTTKYRYLPLDDAVLEKVYNRISRLLLRYNPGKFIFCH